jgi:hypothetical protein
MDYTLLKSEGLQQFPFSPRQVITLGLSQKTVRKYGSVAGVEEVAEVELKLRQAAHMEEAGEAEDTLKDFWM